ALSAIRATPVAPSRSRTGTTGGAALLASGGTAARPPEPVPVEPLRHPALESYAAAWREAASRST
ncbi:MAG TPA: hypothetical protein VN240_07350, partial [Propylenella sp.]|nr:hypothetical protein [Propylenella sp.]